MVRAGAGVIARATAGMLSFDGGRSSVVHALTRSSWLGGTGSAGGVSVRGSGGVGVRGFATSPLGGRAASSPLTERLPVGGVTVRGATGVSPVTARWPAGGVNVRGATDVSPLRCGVSVRASGPDGERWSCAWIPSRSRGVRLLSISVASSFWPASKNERYASA